MASQIVNTEAARAWNGIDGEHWPRHADTYDRAVARHYAHMRAAWDIGPRDRVLDIGCGNGEATLDAARVASSGRALGADLSLGMLEVARARARAAGVKNADFEEIDVQAHPFKDGEFDAAISRFGSMFFADMHAAFRNIHRAMRPGGRLTLLTWQGPEKNEWLREFQGALSVARREPDGPPSAGGQGPFSQADPVVVRDLLAGAGFQGIDLAAHDEPMWFGATADDAYDFMSTSGLAVSMLAEADEVTRRRALTALRATFEAHATADGVLYASGTWLVTARACPSPG